MICIIEEYISTANSPLKSSVFVKDFPKSP